MFLVGLTGGIATGKSLVASLFKEDDIPVIDADLIAREIVEIGKPAYNKIRKHFGSNVFQENGELDRIQLGKEIFGNLENRKLLNSITHPYIYGEMKKQVFRYFLAGKQFVLLDLPLLFETKSVLPYLHKTIVVSCDHETQLDRLMKRNSYSEKEAKRRIEAQMNLEEKTSLADFVIENSGSILSTRNQTEGIIKVLKSSRCHIWNRIAIFCILILIVAVFVGLPLSYYTYTRPAA
ncbi:UNVERIFIED_CONTAM: hypothetical protein GTU68_026820 [Idotea baltica]|nr:hypothetical protein [Idotea baltica]